MDKEITEIRRKLQADPDNEIFVKKYEAAMSRIGYIKFFVVGYDENDMLIQETPPMEGAYYTTHFYDVPTLRHHYRKWWIWLKNDINLFLDLLREYCIELDLRTSQPILKIFDRADHSSEIIRSSDY